MLTRSRLVAAGLGMLALALPFAVSAADSGPKGKDAAAAAGSRDDRMKWFREARFGMFIHWGIYAVPAGEWNGKTSYAEWIMNQAKIPSAEYEKLAPRFNPVEFNAREWVRV